LRRNVDFYRVDWVTALTLWLAGLAAGALITVGVAGIALGRVLVSPRGVMWSARLARIHSLCSLLQGVTASAYTLFGSLSLGAHILPQVWLANVWAGIPFAFAMVLTLGLQLWAQYRNALIMEAGAGSADAEAAPSTKTLV